MSKQEWVEAFEYLEEELGREPTYEEVDERVIEVISYICDIGKDLRKYGNIHSNLNNGEKQ